MNKEVDSKQVLFNALALKRISGNYDINTPWIEIFITVQIILANEKN